MDRSRIGRWTVRRSVHFRPDSYRIVDRFHGMDDRTVRATWCGSYRCEVEAGDFTVVVDEPESAGGSNQGPQPTDLLLASMASCFALALVYAAGKREVVLSSVDVDATGVYDGARFRTVEISARLGCDPGEVDRLVRVAEGVCYVANTLRQPPEIVVSACHADG